MKIIYNKIIPPPSFVAINLFEILFVRCEYKNKISPKIKNHEKIHTYQMRELGYILFYIIYVFEWLIRLLICLFKKENLSRAYYNISFEQEAYNNDSNFEYLKNRKHYSQWRKNKNI